MAVSITTRTQSHITILDCDGELSQSTDAGVIREAIHREIDSGHCNILVNVRQVSHLGLLALAEMIAGAYTIGLHGGSLKLSGISHQLTVYLRNTGLLSALEVFDDERLALRSFGLNS